MRLLSSHERAVLQFPGLSFRSQSLYDEFISSKATDPRVRSLAFEMGFYASQLGVVLKITQIGRNRRSQVEIYGYDRRSGHRERPSRAIDISAKNLSETAISKLLRHFKTYLDRGRYYSLIYHDAGAGKHLHLQAPHAAYNRILWDINSH